MDENLTTASWKEIEGRADVLALADGQVLYLEAPLDEALFSLCWNSGRFTLLVTQLEPSKLETVRKTHPCLLLSDWSYIQVDEQRPNYRVLLKMVYLSQQLKIEVVKDAKMRFPGPLGDVKLTYC